MTTDALNPFQLAVLLHFEPERAHATPGAASHKPVVEHWLRQLGHFDPLFASEYLEAPPLLAELLVEARSHAARLDAVTRDERFHHWGFCRHLQSEADAAASASPSLAGEWSELAVAVASRLEPARYHPAWTADLRAKAWSALAEASRRLERIPAARAALAEARRHAGAGTGCPALAARLTGLEAKLTCRANGQTTRSRNGDRGEAPRAERPPPRPPALGEPAARRREPRSPEGRAARRSRTSPPASGRS